MNASNRPNVVVYISHDTGRFIGPYGVATVQTPNADRVAAEGAVFENSFCTAPQCSPSRAGLFTGRYPHANGVMGLTQGHFAWNLSDGQIHLAQRLKDLGYATAVMGTTHETRNDLETHKKIGFEFDTGWPFRLEKLPGALNEFLAGNGGTGRPFYIQIGTAVTHRPFDLDGAEPDDSLGVTLLPYLAETPGTRKDFAALQGSVKRWDEGLGDVLKALDSRGLADNTILVVTTDHGIAMPRAKCSLYDLGIGVLLLIRWPGGPVPAGARYEELVSNVDVVPTLLEAVGGEADGSIQGRSFWPLLAGGSYEQRQEIFAEMTFHTYYDPMRCIRTQRYKYIRNFEMCPGMHMPGDVRRQPTFAENAGLKLGQHPYEELYDLQSGPNELKNLAGDRACAEVRVRLCRALANWMRATGDPLLEGPIPSPFYRKSVGDLLDSLY